LHFLLGSVPSLNLTVPQGVWRGARATFQWMIL